MLCGVVKSGGGTETDSFSLWLRKLVCVIYCDINQRFEHNIPAEHAAHQEGAAKQDGAYSPA